MGSVRWDTNLVLLMRSYNSPIRRIVLIGVLLLSFIILTSFAEINTDNCQVYTIGNTEEHKIALTFDDGPHSEKTPGILDILKENEVKATFFIVGENAAGNEEIIERIISEGHEIGNHTFGHKYLFKVDRRVMEREIDLCDDEIFNHSEYNARIFRPPGGIYNDLLADVCNERGYDMVLWSIDTRDWAGTSAEDIEREILDNVEDGAIILLHDYVCGESHTDVALKSVIPKLKELGYSFVTVSELIGN